MPPTPAQKTYDYLIIGGGTAGLVLANRLSASPSTTVAVLEAGDDATTTDPRVSTPGMFAAMLGSERDWAFGGVPQPGLNDRRIGLNSGHVLGGSSSTNLLAFIPFSAADADAWAAIGNKGWDWETLSKSMKRSFTLKMPDREDVVADLGVEWARELVARQDDEKQQAGAGAGPLRLSFADNKDNSIAKAWISTFETLGHRLSASPFSGKSVGAYTAPSTIDPDSRTRSSSRTAYYQPVAGRKNLTVLTGCRVEKILFSDPGEAEEESRAIGVQALLNNEKVTIPAAKEILLTAGVFASPKLLELSGIGDPSILSEHNIPVMVANPYVGTNLQDHILCSISFEVKDGVETLDDMMRKDPDVLAEAMRQYKEEKSGPLARTPCTSFGYLPTMDFIESQGELSGALDLLSADTTATGLPQHPLDSARRGNLRRLLENAEEGTGQYLILPFQTRPPGLDTTTTTLGSNPQPGNFLSIVTALSHPLSTGSSHISSSDAAAHPTINHNYLRHPLDLELHARHALTLERIASSQPFASLLKPHPRRHHPSAFLNGDLAAAKEFVKAASGSNWHSVGTCSMAPRERGGVVDEELRVYGTSGLRVVDASVVPFVPQSNTQSLVYAVAERAAGIISQGSDP